MCESGQGGGKLAGNELAPTSPASGLPGQLTLTNTPLPPSQRTSCPRTRAPGPQWPRRAAPAAGSRPASRRRSRPSWSRACRPSCRAWWAGRRRPRLRCAGGKGEGCGWMGRRGDECAIKVLFEASTGFICRRRSTPSRSNTGAADPPAPASGLSASCSCCEAASEAAR